VSSACTMLTGYVKVRIDSEMTPNSLIYVQGRFGLHCGAHALSIEPWSLVRGATAIISPLGLTSTSFVAMVALFDNGVNLSAFSASSP